MTVAVSTPTAVGRTMVAMGTTVTIKVIPGPSTPGDAGAAIDRALAWFPRVEACCSRFDAASELSRLCHRSGGPVVASDLLLHAVSFALALAERTNGAFDPAVGATMLAAGYDRHHATGAPAPLPAGDGTWRDISCDRAARTITLARPLQLDLGAVVKGLAIDLACRELAACMHYTVDAGGDVFAAGQPAPDRPWRVGISHPLLRGTLIDTITLDGDAACTSATVERGPHLRDARTGAPARDLASVTVVAQTAMAADALGTAAFVMGPERATALLDEEGVDALLVHPDGSLTLVGAWERRRWRPA